MRQFKNVEIILEESQAVLANSLYIIPLGNGKAKAVVTDANGNKVAITSDVPDSPNGMQDVTVSTDPPIGVPKDGEQWIQIEP